MLRAARPSCQPVILRVARTSHASGPAPEPARRARGQVTPFHALEFGFTAAECRLNAHATARKVPLTAHPSH